MPRVTDFAKFPASWYLLCRARDLDRGPVSRRIVGVDLVAWRPDPSKVIVMEGRCSHMGADLGKGSVVDGCLQCPFHGWRYGPDGVCRHIPLGGAPPPWAQQRVYPVVERHGLVFFFNGPEPFFPLPFFWDERPEDFTRAEPVEFLGDCTWFMVAAHGFDTQHFETVHSRRLHAPLVVDSPAPFARRSRYTADVLGGAWYDRLLRRLAGPTVEISITTWAGTLFLITGRFRRATSRFIIAATPTEDGKTFCSVIAFVRRGGGPAARLFVQPLSLRLRRMFTGAYLVAEANGLGSPRYNPLGFVEHDREMQEYFRWAAALPAAAARTSRGDTP